MSITSANAVITLAVPLLFPIPVVLQGFATDDIYDVPSIKAGEAQMGVDGNLSGGFVFEPVPQTFTLQADSPSNAFFDNLYQAEQALHDKYTISGTTVLLGIASKWNMPKGFLTDYTPMPSGKRVLQPRKYIITWQSAPPAST